jgi:putative transposase
MNVYLEHLSAAFPDDLLLLAMDKASWHRSKGLLIPQNIRILHIPPYTPEMNPIEQIWKELRKLGFRNDFFKTLDKVVEPLCFTINSLTNEIIKSITGRDWIISMF